LIQDKFHQYDITIQWTGNQGSGTTGYHAYGRDHLISIENKTGIMGSSDPAFLGDKTRHNPEELFVSAIASCHMLWYLHLCAQAGVVVTAYLDHARGEMSETDGLRPASGQLRGGRFISVTLNPEVTVMEPGMIEKALQLHQKANELCFIANSVNFPVRHRPVVKPFE